MRSRYDKTERPIEIVVGRNTAPNRRQGDYAMEQSLGDFERQQADFVKFGTPSLCDGWRVARPIKAEKVRDTHKLACLGLPDDKIRLWPCPDPTTCKCDRCPERPRVVDEIPL